MGCSSLKGYARPNIKVSIAVVTQQFVLNRVDVKTWEQAWKDTFEFREALGAAVGLQNSATLGSPGMQVLPVFEAVAAEDETVDLISFDTGHPKALLDWLAVTDPIEERFVWEE